MRLTAARACIVVLGALLLCRPLADAWAQPPEAAMITGVVFADLDDDGVPGPDEERLAGVAVSDGAQVVVTDEQGRYRLETEAERVLVRLTVPSGWWPADGAWFAWVETGGERHFPLRPQEQPETWAFIHVTDLHMTPARVENQRAFAREVNELDEPPVALVAATGDLIHEMRSLREEDDLRTVAETYHESLSALEAPLLNVPGNHDLAGYRAEMDPEAPLFGLRAYEAFIGPGCYSVQYAGTHIISVFNTLVNIPLDGGYRNGLPDRCLAWLEADLAHVDPAMPLILLMHQSPGRMANRAEVLELLEGRTVLGIFHGHHHTLRDYEWEGIAVYEGGSLSSCSNAPRGYAVVTISEGRLVGVQYRALGAQTGAARPSGDRGPRVAWRAPPATYGTFPRVMPAPTGIR